MTTYGDCNHRGSIAPNGKCSDCNGGINAAMEQTIKDAGESFAGIKIIKSDLEADKLKTLNQLDKTTIMIPDESAKSCESPCIPEVHIQLKQLRAEAIKWIKNLQYKDTQYGIVLDSLPESMRGEIAKDKWNQTDFRYGSEYGMLAFIKHFFGLTDEDLNAGVKQ